MSDLSDYLENTILDNQLSGTIYVALFLDDPTDADTGTEVSGPGYSRQSVTFAAASSGQKASDAAVAFSATGLWGEITHIGLYDALSGGNLLFHRELDLTPVVDDGDTVNIDAGDLVAILD